MKFLTKRADSSILAQNLTYKKGQGGNNEKLRDALLSEQKNFCAYSERYIKNTDSPEVEHFNAEKKYADDYYNYYTVIRWANQSKEDEKYKGNSFFTSLFFQDKVQFDARIAYSEGEYFPVQDNDTEADDLIRFLGFNKYELYLDRQSHLDRLRFIFDGKTQEEKLQYFRTHKDELSFITAIEIEFDLDLSSLLQ
jgi:hypothetical protein